MRQMGGGARPLWFSFCHLADEPQISSPKAYFGEFRKIPKIGVSLFVCLLIASRARLQTRACFILAESFVFIFGASEGVHVAHKHTIECPLRTRSLGPRMYDTKWY